MKQVTKRLISMILSLALFGSAALAYFNFTSPEYEKMQKIRSERAGIEKFIEEQRATIEKVVKLAQSYEQQKELQQRVSLAFPLQPDVSGAVQQITGLAQNNRIGVTSLSVSALKVEKPDKPVSAAAKKKAAAAGSDAFVKQIGNVELQVQFKGSYEAFKEFMKGVETNLRAFQIKTVEVKPEVGPTDNIYSFTMEVVAFYQAP
jgi:Tfp pilus assembly protein PilO